MSLLTLLLAAEMAFAQGAPPSTAKVLVPEFTAVTVSDLVVAELLYQSFLQALQANGLSVVTSEQIMEQTPDLASGCADTPSCPGALLTYYRAPLVLVVKVGREGDDLEISTAFYGAGGKKAIAEATETLAPGQETAFARRTADQAREILALLGGAVPVEPEPRIGPARPPELPPDVPPDLPPEVKPDPPEVKPDPPDDPPDAPPDDPPDDPQPPGAGGLLVIGAAEQQQRELGLSEEQYKSFLNSGMAEDAWLHGRRVHSNLVSLEFQGGAGGGGLAQLYEVVYRVEHDGSTYTFNESAGDNRATQQALVDVGAPTPGTFAAFGVHVNTHVEVQLLGGVWRSQQLLVRGWVVDSDVYGQVGPAWESTDADGAPTAEAPTGGAMAGLLEPRVRYYPRGLGVLKPYALGGASFLVFSGYQIGDKQMQGEDGAVSAWAYDDPGGLNVPGIVGGGGLMIDAHYRLGLFAEGVYTWNIPVATHTIHTVEGPLGDAQQSYEVAGSSWRVASGVQLRF